MQGKRVLVVDQWIETGGTMNAAIRLVEKVGGIVVGVAAIAIENSSGAKDIKAKVKSISCIPEGEEGVQWQKQIDRRFMNSWD